MKKYLILLLLITSILSCKKKDETEGKLPQVPDSQILEFPVVFHVIHEGATVGSGDNIPAAWVQYYFNNLNRYWSGQSTSGINTNIKFKLATKNPSNAVMTEPGIDRINLGQSSFSETTVYNNASWGKNLVWNPNEYINIFIIDVAGGYTLAWSHPPYSSKKNVVKGLFSSDEENFANFANSQSLFFRKSTIDLFYNNGETYATDLVHEMGHYFGLDHTFRGSCTADGDFVDDTNDFNTAVNNFTTDFRKGCNGQTYTSINFMDYTNTGGKQFTAGQITRMRQVASWCALRKDTWKSTR